MERLGIKLKLYSRQRSNILNYSSKISNNSNINIYGNILRFNNLHYNYNSAYKVESQKKRIVIIRYRICHRRITQFLNFGGCFPGIIEDLMDKLRGILNIMIEDENGMYHKNEILKVSRELDNIIYMYYNCNIAV